MSSGSECYGSFNNGAGGGGQAMVDSTSASNKQRHKRLLTADVTNIFNHFGMFGGIGSPQRSSSERIGGLTNDPTKQDDPIITMSSSPPSNDNRGIFRPSGDLGTMGATIEEEDEDPDVERARLMDRLKHGSYDEADGIARHGIDPNKPNQASFDEGEEGERFVTYDSASHFGVLFQLHGSVWPKVFPYCVVNTVFFWIVVYVDSLTELDLSVSSVGHSLTALLLAFLVIQRSGIVYSRYMNARHCLEDMNRICCEIVQIACIYSKHDCSEEAKSWRSRLAFTTILLLRTTVAALEFNNTKINAWDILPDSTSTLKSLTSSSSSNPKSNTSSTNNDNSGAGNASADTNTSTNPSRSSLSSSMITTSGSSDRLMSFVRDSLNAMDQDRTGHLILQERWAHGKRSVLNRNYKAPSVLAYRLRDTVLENRRKVVKPHKMQLLEEVQISNLINSYVIDYQKLKADISTPFPFPFVQMARTFLFVWVFSIPFAMARDVKNIPLASFLVFFATYGFIGVEFVSMELDDPYGDDANDIDDVALAQMTFEDIYISILKTDGLQRATKLRETVKNLAKRSVVVQQRQPPPPTTTSTTVQSQEIAKHQRQVSFKLGSDGTAGNVTNPVTMTGDVKEKSGDGNATTGYDVQSCSINEATPLQSDFILFEQTLLGSPNSSTPMRRRGSLSSASNASTRTNGILDIY